VNTLGGDLLLDNETPTDAPNNAPNNLIAVTT
jgi:hypothetical protein